MCALIRKHIARALIMAEGEEEIVPAPGTSFVDTTSGSECEDDEPTSILDVLKAPKAAAQNRKRKVLTNRGCGAGVRRHLPVPSPRELPRNNDP